VTAITAFTALLAAHLLGWFVFQAPWIAARKQRLWVRALRASGVTLLSCLLLGAFRWPILLVIFLTHAAVEEVKAHRAAASLAALLARQSVHLAVLLALALRFPDAAQSGWWMSGAPPVPARWYCAFLTLVSGLILCVPAGGILIARLTRRFADEVGSSESVGLKHGGKYIGWLERFLVMLLLLIDQPGGIGFLITAKSILRFGETRDPAYRKVAEYIIIGTFLSFGWALLISVLTQRALKYWVP